MTSKDDEVLLKKIEELKENSERYEWLRDNCHLDAWFSINETITDRAVNINNTIDAAMLNGDTEPRERAEVELKMQALELAHERFSRFTKLLYDLEIITLRKAEALWRIIDNEKEA